MSISAPSFIQKRLLCLASSSPRRHELLKRYGLTFDSCTPDVDEARRQGESVQAYGLRIAHQKAVAGSSFFPDSIIISGDTTVFHNRQVLGKPRDAQHACTILKKLNGYGDEVDSYAVNYRICHSTNEVRKGR